MNKAILFWVMLFCSCLQAGLDQRHSLERRCANIYSTSTQHLFPGEIIRFEKVGASSPNVNLSFAMRSGTIIFNKAGTYKISWHGQSRSPFNVPWTLGFSLDGVILLGNVYGPLGCSPTQPFEGSVVLSINADQTLQFVNASPHPVELVSILNDSGAPLPSFAVQLCRFAPD